ncbi:MAG: HAMP domain-containing sensor histidine kinase [Ilumatobacteraceae bacterium]
MSLRLKVAILLAVIVSVGVTAVSIITYRATDTRLMEEVDRSLVQATERFLQLPGRNRPNVPGRTVINIPERPLGVEQFVVQVSDLSGNVLASTEGVSLPITVAGVATDGSSTPAYSSVTTAEGIDYRVRTVQVSTGVVQLGRDLTENLNVLHDLRERMVLVAAIVAVIAALVGWFTVSGVTRRLRRLSTAVEEVATTGRLDVATSQSGNDEAGRLGRRFSEMLAAQSSSREQQQRLVEDAGHELRTPLTSLRTNLDVLRRHADLAPDVRAQIVTDIDRDVADLESLVEEVVSLAADRHADELPQPVVLRNHVVTVVERAARRSGRTVDLMADESVCIVRPQLFERAVSNLIDNAIKFDTSGGPIEVDITKGTVTVCDRGPGIEDGQESRIFERFHRANSARTLPGSGLGLSIVADVASSHGGSVFARRRTGGGAEVGFTLPIV